MKRLLPGILALLFCMAASCGSSTPSDNEHDTVVTGQKLTPGQRLDTALSDTRRSADETTDRVETVTEQTRDGIDNAYDKTREGLREAGRDIKEAAHEAGEKVKEGTSKAAESVEHKSKEIKEDIKK